MGPHTQLACSGARGTDGGIRARAQLGMGLPKDVDSGPDHSLSLVDSQLNAPPPRVPGTDVSSLSLG